MRGLIKILARCRLLQFFNLSFKEHDIQIPVIRGLGYGNVYGTENWMKQLIQKLLKVSDGCFVDVGVNVGQTFIKLRQIDKHIRYIGFEPNPYCVFYVEELFRLNKITNSEVVPLGISTSNEIITLNYFSDDLTDSSASIIPNFRSGQKVKMEKNIVVGNYEIVREKLDQRIGIVKIDVEGAELHVIKGMKPLIVRDRPFIAIEVLPVYSESNIDRLSRQTDLEKELTELNYSLLRVIKRPDGTFGDLELIKSIGIHSDLDKCDYVFAPVEKVEELLDEKTVVREYSY